MPESTTEVLQDNPLIKELINCTVNLAVEYSKTYNNKIMEINQQINAVEEAQQKEYKRIKDTMKADITKQCAEQGAIKLQRKTVNFSMYSNKNNRVHESSEATQLAHLNGIDLRHLFIAYAIFRIQGGYTKCIPETAYHYDQVRNAIIRKDGKAIRNDENSPRIELITKILEKYGASINSSKTVHIGA